MMRWSKILFTFNSILTFNNLIMQDWVSSVIVFIVLFNVGGDDLPINTSTEIIPLIEMIIFNTTFFHLFGTFWSKSQFNHNYNLMVPTWSCSPYGVVIEGACGSWRGSAPHSYPVKFVILCIAPLTEHIVLKVAAHWKRNMKIRR